MKAGLQERLTEPFCVDWAHAALRQIADRRQSALTSRKKCAETRAEEGAPDAWLELHTPRLTKGLQPPAPAMTSS